MILLPPHPQRAWLRAFGLTLTVLSGIVIVLLCRLQGTHCLVGGTAVSVLGLAAWLRPDIFRLPYRVWNKLGRLYGCFAEAVLLRVAFFSIVVPVGWAGSFMRAARSTTEPSVWLVRRTPGPTGRQDTHWALRYIAWAWCAGEMWRIALLPYLMVLGCFKAEEEAALSDNLYTLF